MVPLSTQDKTRVIEKDELDAIKKETSGVYYNEDEEPEEENQDEDYDEEDEEDDDEAINPKMEKAITIMGIAAGVVIVGIIIYLIASFFGLVKFGGHSKDTETETQTETQTETETEDESAKKVEMIDLTGMTFEEAQTALKKIKLGIKDNGTVSSDTVEEGKVAEQDYKKGEKVAENTTIKVKISSGKGEISVPSVVGSDESSAGSTLKSAGFKVSTQYEYNNTVAEGKVISQTPDAGASGKEGDTVTITVSQGVKTVTVPNVLGQSQDAATSALTGAGLTLSSVSSDYSDTVAAGSVISQSIADGKIVDEGTSITLVVSLGPKVKLYSFSAKIEAPKNDDGTTNENVSAANIVLKDASGNVLETWSNQSIASFPLSISKSGIEGQTSGTVEITWMDASGNTMNTQTQNVTFQEQ